MRTDDAIARDLARDVFEVAPTEENLRAIRTTALFDRERLHDAADDLATEIARAGVANFRTARDAIRRLIGIQT